MKTGRAGKVGVGERAESGNLLGKNLLREGVA
jgi:hypothetical protein